jgi:hypothetical protein
MRAGVVRSLALHGHWQRFRQAQLQPYVWLAQRMGLYTIEHRIPVRNPRSHVRCMGGTTIPATANAVLRAWRNPKALVLAEQVEDLHVRHC